MFIGQSELGGWQEFLVNIPAAWEGEEEKTKRKKTMHEWDQFFEYFNGGTLHSP